MAEPDLIERYLSDLAIELRLPRRRRQRVLLEVEDHLLESAAQSSPVQAIASFGPPHQIATHFTAELAASTVRGASLAVLAALAAFCALFALAGNMNEPLATAVIQIALTVAAITTIRLIRHRHEAAFPLRYVDRGNAVVSALLVLALGSKLAASGGHRTLVLAALVLAAIAAAATARAAWRRRLTDQINEEDVLDDIRALVPAIDRLPRALDLRLRPWRTATLVASSAGITAAACHGMAEGLPGAEHLDRALAAALLISGSEALLVLASFALLGRFLGLRRRG